LIVKNKLGRLATKDAKFVQQMRSRLNLFLKVLLRRQFETQQRKDSSEIKVSGPQLENFLRMDVLLYHNKLECLSMSLTYTLV